jgi:NADPH2:quinone reductase
MIRTPSARSFCANLHGSSIPNGTWGDLEVNNEPISTMHAAWYDRFGPAREVLESGVTACPAPEIGEVLVQIHASGVNPHDVKKRSGWMGTEMPAPRVIPHGDAAGIVVAHGAGVTGPAIGERVWIYGAAYGRPGAGTAAQYAAIPAGHAVPLPDGMTFEQGASLGVPTFTAYYALLADGPVTGQDILVQGGAGAVGSVAIELARWNGARVIATVSSPEKEQIARAAGADHVVNYRSEDVAARIMDLTAGRGVDRIVEVDFGDNITTNAAVLKSNGVLASYSSTRVREPVFRYYDFALKGCRIHLVQATTMPASVRETAKTTVRALLDRGMLVPRIARVVDLTDIAAAHELMESGTVTGNIVVRTQPD